MALRLTFYSHPKSAAVNILWTGALPKNSKNKSKNWYTNCQTNIIVWCDFDRASSLICGNKMPTRCNRGFYCRSYCLLNMFRAPLCPPSVAQEYYTVVAACGILCCGFQVAGLVWSWGLCVRFAGSCSILQTGHITLSWWAQWCPKHVEQAIRSAIKTSVASSWHFISTY